MRERKDKNLYGLSERILKEAKSRRRRVGIIILESNREIEKYLRLANKIAEVVVVGSKIKDLESYEIKDPEEAGKKVIEMLDTKQIDALVRGQLHPRTLFLPLCQRAGKESAYFDGSLRESPFIFENRKTKRFFVLGGVDIISGISYAQKEDEVFTLLGYFKEINIKPFVALMTMRRAKPKDAKPIKGLRPFPIIEETYEIMEKIYQKLKTKNIKAEMFNIEYETAIERGANLIISPIGGIGNAFARSLVFFSQEWEVIRGQVIKLRPYIIEEGFKTGHGKHFYNHIISAASTANTKNVTVKY